MPIFSANRVSGIGSTVVAAEGYTENDFGRILSECAINDMRLFNAAIARDFKEAQAMQEGTMMQSEIQALQEFSVKEAWKGLKEKVKKLWSKIKGVFKSVYAKLSLWLVRNNKAYIAMHRKDLLSKDCSKCKCPKFLNPTHDYLPTIASFSDVAKETKEWLSGKALDDVVKELGNPDSYAFKNATQYLDNSGDTITADKIYEELMKQCFDSPKDSLTFADTYYGKSGGGVRGLMNNLSSGSEYLKTMKKLNNSTDKFFKGILSKLDKAEGKAEDGSAAQKGYSAASKIVSKFQTSINAAVSASIRVIKKGINNDRGLMATLVSYNPKAPVNDAAMLEFAYMAGHDAFFLETEDMTDDDVEAAAEEEGVTITIDIDGNEDVDVDVNDNTDE